MEYFHNTSIFLVIDESEIRKTKHFNVLAATIDNPNMIFLIDCVQLTHNINSTIVINLILKSIEQYNIHLNQIIMIISDAASYMKKAINDLNRNCHNILHVKCLAHLVHNCAMRIRGFYKNVDLLIASVKMITIKNRTTMSLFSGIGIPPAVIVTRWSSWLRAALYYANNLPGVRRVIDTLFDEGVLVKRAKEAVNEPFY